MLSHVSIRNYQSLKKVDLELLGLTVIVGPSSSGKSALTRALKTLTGNTRGSAFITHGEKLMTVQAQVDRGSVTLKRGKGTEDNEYVIIPDDPNVDQRTFTKLGGSVPEEVSAFIGIEPKDPINYAGQFDAPYLLNDSGGEVARVLGALTNVNVLFEGARESNRRKLNYSGQLKTRAEDLATIREKAKSYAPLKAQLAAVGRAEESLIEARSAKKDIDQLSRYIETVDMADTVVANLEKNLKIPVPDAAPITAAADALAAYKAVIARIRTQSNAAKDASVQVTELSAEQAELQDQYTELLIEAGNCPTCGQGTTELEHGHAA